MAKKVHTYNDIIKQIKAKEYCPIYVLMGEEAYYIDKICDLLESCILTEDEKNLNLNIRYANDKAENKVDIVSNIINDCQSFPMFSEKRVVVLKECQGLDRKDKLDKLAAYLEHINDSTILIITYKYGKIDARKKWLALADKHGIVFESKKLYDNQVESFINSCSIQHKLNTEPQASAMILESIGSDLAQIESLYNKLALLLPQDSRVTAEIIEKTTGVSKDYTAFELQNAIIERNVLKANKIIKHTSTAIQATIAILYNYFSGLLIYHYLPDKSKENVVAKLKIAPFACRNYEIGARNFNKMQAFKAIGYLREYDGKSKGINSVNANDFELMRELIFKIMH